MGRAGLASEEGHHLPPTWRVLQDLRQGGSGASCQCQLEEGRLGQGWARGERSLCFTERGAHRVKNSPALAQLSWAGPGPAWVWLAGSLSARSCGSEPGLRPVVAGFSRAVSVFGQRLGHCCVECAVDSHSSRLLRPVKSPPVQNQRTPSHGSPGKCRARVLPASGHSSFIGRSARVLLYLCFWLGHCTSHALPVP